ncbi:ABC transporter ATP-binding protein [soil metagenome]
MSTAPLMQVTDLVAGYGEIRALHGLTFAVAPREIVAVLGANGAGKTTLLSSIAGLVRRFSGSVTFDGRSIEAAAAQDIVASGLVMVPEGGKLFPFMTVRENLELGAFSRGARKRMAQSLDEMFELFPILAQRSRQMAGSLSGGERTMCAIARGVMSCPTLLMLDEPSLGLSPKMVESVFELVRTLANRRQMAILLVEQNVGDALQLASRGLVIEQGRIVKAGASADLLGDVAVQNAYLGL